MIVNNTTKRIVFLDSIRGLACLLVLIQHIFEQVYPTFLHITFQYINFGIIGIVAFFVVSGFIIPFCIEKSTLPPPLTAGFFLIRRFFRIYPLYLVIFILTLLFIIVIKGNTVAFPIVLVNLTLFQEYVRFPLIVGVSWTLSFEIIWYILFVIFFLLGLNKKNCLLILAASMVLIILAIVSIITNTRVLIMGRAGFVHCCFIGLLFYRFRTQKISLSTFYLLLTVSLFSLLLSFTVTYGYFKDPRFSLGCIIASWLSGIGLFLFFLIFNKTKYRAILQYLGFISYSIYLTHSLLLRINFYYFEKTCLIGLVTILETILISHVTYYWIEQKGIHLGKKLITKLKKY